MIGFEELELDLEVDVAELGRAFVYALPDEDDLEVRDELGAWIVTLEDQEREPYPAPQWVALDRLERPRAGS